MHTFFSIEKIIQLKKKFIICSYTNPTIIPPERKEKEKKIAIQ